MAAAPYRLFDVEVARIERLTPAMARYDAELATFDSVLVHRGDALVFEEYFHESDRDAPRQLRSAAKALMALLAGVALDRGAIASLYAPALAYFPEYQDLANLDDCKRAITIRHLLTNNGTKTRTARRADTASRRRRRCVQPNRRLAGFTAVASAVNQSETGRRQSGDRGR